MAFSAEIRGAPPACLLFLLDQSGSMGEELAPGITKAAFLADVLNRSLMELVERHRRGDAPAGELDIGVFAYSGSSVGPAFAGALAGSHLCEVAALAASPARVERRRKRVPDGAGGLVEAVVDFPVWFEPQAAGGTPMCAALRLAGDLLTDWCREHPRSPPPVVLHVTDGEATDGTAAEVTAAAERLAAQGTGEGRVVLLNLHLPGSGAEPVRVPAVEPPRLDALGKLLFAISSVLPPEMQRRATELGLPAGSQSRGLVCNARMPDVVAFFQLATSLRRGVRSHWVRTTAESLRGGTPAWRPSPPAEAVPTPAEPPPAVQPAAPPAPLATAAPVAPPAASAGRERLAWGLAGLGGGAALALFALTVLEEQRSASLPPPAVPSAVAPEPPARTAEAPREVAAPVAAPVVTPVPPAPVAPPPPVPSGAGAEAPVAATPASTALAIVTVPPAMPVPVPVLAMQIPAAPPAEQPSLIPPAPSPQVAGVPAPAPEPVAIASPAEAAVPAPATPAAEPPPAAPREPAEPPPVWIGQVRTREWANVREAPSIEAPVARTARPGAVLRLYGQAGSWARVGEEQPWGWVHSSLLDPVR